MQNFCFVFVTAWGVLCVCAGEGVVVVEAGKGGRARQNNGPAPVAGPHSGNGTQAGIRQEWCGGRKEGCV